LYIYLLDFSGILPSHPWGRGNFGGTGFQPVQAQAEACRYIYGVNGFLQNAKSLPNIPLCGALGGPIYPWIRGMDFYVSIFASYEQSALSKQSAKLVAS
jgi:hypothetical protein